MVVHIAIDYNALRMNNVFAIYIYDNMIPNTSANEKNRSRSSTFLWINDRSFKKSV